MLPTVAKRDRIDLLEALAEQLEFLDLSCASFDAGNRSEAKRLALTVRVLCHTTKNSHGLLNLLGDESNVQMWDSLPEWHSRFKTVGGGLAHVRLGGPMTGWHPISAPHPETGKPVHEVTGGVLRPFKLWWPRKVMFPSIGDEPTRSGVVLWLANKDGGAHIDDLPERYSALKSGEAMGVRIGGENGAPVDQSPFPAVMRQIAEEVRLSLRSFYALELAQVARAPHQ